MNEQVGPLPKAKMIELAEQWDQDRKDGKKPLLVVDGVNFGGGVQVQYSNDDTRKSDSDVNPFDEIIEAMGG